MIYLKETGVRALVYYHVVLFFKQNKKGVGGIIEKPIKHDRIQRMITGSLDL